MCCQEVGTNFLFFNYDYKDYAYDYPWSPIVNTTEYI